MKETSILVVSVAYMRKGTHQPITALTEHTPANQGADGSRCPRWRPSSPIVVQCRLFPYKSSLLLSKAFRFHVGHINDIYENI